MRIRNQGTVRMYLDERGKWRWQVRSVNGKIIGASSQGYTRRVNCSTNMHRLVQALTPPIRWSNDDESQRDSEPDQVESAASG